MKPLPSQSRWRCHQCGAVSTSWAAAVRHADKERHARIELVR